MAQAPCLKLIQSSQIDNHIQCVAQFPFDGYFYVVVVTVTVGTSALAVNLKFSS